MYLAFLAWDQRVEQIELMVFESRKLCVGNWGLLLLILFSHIEALPQTNTDSLLKTLHQAIEKKDVYDRAKLEGIQRLKNQLPEIRLATPVDQFNLYQQLCQEYQVFIYDSAFVYAQKLLRVSYQLRDPSRINYAKLKMGFILVSSGMFKETFDSLKTVDVRSLPDSLKVDYYSILARSFFDLGNYDNDPYYNATYVRMGVQRLDSALMFCKPGSYSYLYISNYRDMMSNHTDAALEEVKQLLTTLPLTDHQRAVNSHHLGSLYLAKGRTDEALKAFTTAAVADLRSATKENAAMNSVADILYKKGDIRNAYELIEFAMEDALFYGAKQRKIQIGSILPIIAAEELSNVEKQRQRWLVYSTALTVLGLLVLVFVFIIVRQVKKLKAAELLITTVNENLKEINHKLREADKIKEEYIGYYFNINSDYIDKIEDVKKGIDQKLMAKKFDDIRFIVNNINLKREREELFVSFDKVFLKLFPDFVTIFNSYFKEEDRIILKDNQLLNAELRIFALIRMGISDTEKIAKILDYSVNTIYTYKTKVKSKSLLPNEEFEKKIMEIMTV